MSVSPKILVTGANGFVGRALCRALADAGFDVRAAVRKPTDELTHARVAVVQAPDLENLQANWDDCLAGIDVVVHTAARVHVMNPPPNHEQLLDAVNARATAHLAQSAARAGAKRFIFLSTIKVNGETTQGMAPFRATDPVAPLEPYAVSKLKAEQNLKALSDQRAIETVIIRPPLVYGEGAKGNLDLLERLIKRSIPLPVGLLGGNRRSLVSLANLVDLIRSCISHPKAANQTFLVSDGDDLSTLRLTRLIAQSCHRSVIAVPVPPVALRLLAGLIGKSDMVSRLVDSLQVDIAPTCRLLDWHPPQTVEQGMYEAFAQHSNP